MTTPDRSRPATWLAKAGFRNDSATGGVAPSIPMSTTYVRDADYELPDGRLYLRGRDQLVVLDVGAWADGQRAGEGD